MSYAFARANGMPALFSPMGGTMSKLPRLACLAVLTLAMSGALAADPPGAAAADAPTTAAVAPEAAPTAPVMLGVDKINAVSSADQTGADRGTA